MDLVYLLLMALLWAAVLAMAFGCERLKGRRS
jgi:hypothetical protein